MVVVVVVVTIIVAMVRAMVIAMIAVSRIVAVGYLSLSNRHRANRNAGQKSDSD